MNKLKYTFISQSALILSVITKMEFFPSSKEEYKRFKEEFCVGSLSTSRDGLLLHCLYYFA